MHFSSLALRELVTRLLEEDIGYGDITTQAIVPPQARGHGHLLAKEALVLAGLEVVDAVFHTVDSTIRLDCAIQDGAHLVSGNVIAELHGPAHALLTAERVALNLLQRLSGVATATRRYVDRVRHTKAHIIDTRKTTPGLRLLEKYAIRVGGGHNHRFGLGDGVLIKDNHIAMAGGVRAALRGAKQRAGHTVKVEIEVDTLGQLKEVIDEGGVDIVMLDNMSLEDMTAAVKLVDGRMTIEASGGVTLERVPAIAATGVDLISSGAITHSVPQFDVGLDYKDAA